MNTIKIFLFFFAFSTFKYYTANRAECAAKSLDLYKTHSKYSVIQNNTNPFNSTITINYLMSDISASSAVYQNVNSIIYDLLGKEVKI